LDDTVLSWNAGAERLYGYTAAEVVGHTAFEIVPDDRTAEIAWFRERIGRGESISAYDTVRQRKDGTVVDVAITASPLRDGSGREVLADLGVRIEETGAQVELGDLPTVDGSASPLRQLFQNLLLNALKYHRPDEPPKLRVRSRQLGDASWEILFEDEGIGFDPKHAKRIFGLFERLHGRSEYAGAGLGLAICRKIVERHSGTIEARGAPGEGATFVVTLPAPRRPRTPWAATPRPAAAAATSVPFRVLVVDDDPDDYEQTRRLLADAPEAAYDVGW